MKETPTVTTQPNLTRRIIAGFVDYTIILGFFFIMAYAFGEPIEDGYSLTGWKAFIPVLFWLLITVVLESSFGSTIGNSIVGLKPVSLTNNLNKPSFIESFKRHLLDPIDMALLGVVGIITISSTEMHQRLGDLWAKTVVIRYSS